MPVLQAIYTPAAYSLPVDWLQVGMDDGKAACKDCQLRRLRQGLLQLLLACRLAPADGWHCSVTSGQMFQALDLEVPELVPRR